MGQFQYPQRTTPVLMPSVAPPAVSWAPKFPDFAEARPLHPATVGAITQPQAPAFPLPKPTAWLPAFPDSAAVATLPTAAHPSFTTGAVAPVLPLPRPLSWQPGFPASVDGKRFPSESMPTGAINPLQIPSPRITFSQSGGIIGRGVRLQYQQVARPPQIILTVMVPLDRWLPQFPDQTRALAPLVDRSAGWAGVITPSVFALPTPLTWQGKYPDRIDVAKPAPDTNQAMRWLNVPPPLPTPLLAWAPRFPDLVTRTHQEPVREMASSHFAVIAGVPLRWAPKFPDFAVAPLFLPALVHATARPTATTVTVPTLAWKGAYPDRIEVTRLPVEAMPHGRIDPFPQVTVVPLLSWAGAFPERVDRATLSTAAMPAFATGVVPGTFPLANPLAWKSVHPDQIWSTTLPTAAHPNWHGPAIAIANPAPVLSWMSVWPDRVDPVPALMVAAHPCAFGWIRSALPVPARAWQGIMVDRAPGSLPLSPGASPSLALVTTSINPVPALAWRGLYPTHVDRFGFVIGPPAHVMWPTPLAKIRVLGPGPTEIRTINPRRTLVSVLGRRTLKVLP